MANQSDIPRLADRPYGWLGAVQAQSASRCRGLVGVWAGSGTPRGSIYFLCLYIPHPGSPPNLPVVGSVTMCGITAFLAVQETPDPAVKSRKESLQSAIDSSLDVVEHRGPDARGQWISEDCSVGELRGQHCMHFLTGIGLGHVRLSIVDLSPEGDQPFHNSRGDVHAVVNGELYGHEKYRAALAEEYDFKGHSDCEIVIALYQHYGLSFLSHLRGEFALILWDASRQLFFAARDRYGIKSLYYTIVDGRLLVATEMKSFPAFGWQPEWSVRSLRESTWYNDSKTFFKKVFKVRDSSC